MCILSDTEVYIECLHLSSIATIHESFALLFLSGAKNYKICVSTLDSHRFLSSQTIQEFAT